MAGFCAMLAVSVRNDEPTRASRPWDKDREGFVLGEGAGVLVIEEREHALRRGAKPIAELVGYARNRDAYHANAPLESGDGVRRAMELALADAAVPPPEIGYLNAHATSTPLGDRAEAAAIRNAFNDRAHRVAVSSTKSMTGHLPGARGASKPALRLLRSETRSRLRPSISNVRYRLWSGLRSVDGSSFGDATRHDQLLRL